MNINLRLSKYDTFVMKGIAIIAMLCWHLFFCPNPLGIEFSSVVRFISIIGDCCVSIFLFVSGYGLTVSYAKEIELNKNGGGILFVINRLVKFYFNFWPIFIIFVPIGILAFNIPMINGESALQTIRIWMIQIIGLSNQQSYNTTWWFNSLIIPLYVLFPLLYESMRKYPIYTIVIFGYCIQNTFGASITKYVPIFFAGIIWARYHNHLSLIIKNIGKTWIFVLLLCALAINTYCLRILGENDIYSRGIINFAVYTLILAFLSKALISKSKIFSLPIVFLGKHSANIYMIHTFLAYYWFPTFFYSWKYPLLIFFFTLGSSLILSVILEKLKTWIGWNKLRILCVNHIEILYSKTQNHFKETYA